MATNAKVLGSLTSSGSSGLASIYRATSSLDAVSGATLTVANPTAAPISVSAAVGAAADPGFVLLDRVLTPGESLAVAVAVAAGQDLLVNSDQPGATFSLSGGPSSTTNVAQVKVLTETFPLTAFTPSGAVGTAQFAGSLPVGATVLGTGVVVDSGFIGNVSATLQIGDGSDVDRYNTGTPNVFATAANGVESGVPSGNKRLTAANSPTLTITASTAFSSVSAGQVTVSIFYLPAA